MSDLRQTTAHDALANDSDPGKPVVAVAQDRPENFDIPAHRHLRAQLLFATSGVMRVSTDAMTWVVPPQQAVWIPPKVEHSAISLGSLAFRTLYIHPDYTQDLPRECCVVTVPGLLRELILRAVRIRYDYARGSLDFRLMEMIPELLSELRPEPIQLPLPTDRRLRTITDALMSDPAHRHSLADWAQNVGASERTLSRHFRQETGISFTEWRQRLRLQSSIRLLSEEKPVTTIAYELGYESPSAFIAMFRRATGSSPKQYLKSRQSGSALP